MVHQPTVLQEIVSNPDVCGKNCNCYWTFGPAACNQSILQLDQIFASDVVHHFSVALVV